MTLSEQLAGNNRTVCAQARGQQGECSAPDAQSGNASRLEPAIMCILPHMQHQIALKLASGQVGSGALHMVTEITQSEISIPGPGQGR